jgi:octaprenyl-diphosphate synthase
MMLLVQQDGAVSERLSADLADVENRFVAELLSDLPCVNRLVSHIERYRGKMLRPTLVLVSGMTVQSDAQADPTPQRVVAAVVEMVHMATLVHDDVLDEAQVRRGGVTVNELEGNETAVMLGDYLISHAYHLCSSLDRPRISRMIADATNTVCEGELLQLANRRNWELDERTYFEIIRRKTASLCGMCCRLGGELSGGDEAAIAGLYEYGEKVGVAFQIVDDLLDLLGREATVGKSLGRDLQKGKLTLPLIHFMRHGDAGDRRRLRAICDELGDADLSAAGPGEPADGLLDEARQLVCRGDSVEYARQWASRLVLQAKTALQSLPDTPPRRLMERMADAVLTRDA